LEDHLSWDTNAILAESFDLVLNLVWSEAELSDDWHHAQEGHNEQEWSSNWLEVALDDVWAGHVNVIGDDTFNIWHWLEG